MSNLRSSGEKDAARRAHTFFFPNAFDQSLTCDTGLYARARKGRLSSVKASLKLMVSGAALVAALPLAAQAQTQVAQGQTVGLETVVVTAEKRVTDLQKTPEAVAAVSNDALVRAGATQLSSLGKLVPDVKITRQAAGATVQIRGVWSTDNSPTSESAVSVDVNGADLAKQMGLQGFLFDLERVEVLKGPQGTLYGRNSNGGTVNIITNKPVLGMKAAEGEVEFGNYNLLRTSGWFNMPLSDTVAMRGAFQTFAHSGFMKSGLGDADQKSGRLSFLWKPDDTQSLWVVADYSKDASLDDEAIYNVTAKQPGVNIYVPSNPRDDTFYNTDTPTHKAEVFQRRSLMQGLTAQYDYNFHFATWTTLLAYRHFDIDPSINPNNIGQGALKVAPDGNTYPSGARNYVPQKYESYSVETRLTSNGSDPLQWVIGLYLFRDIDSGTMIGYRDLRTTSPSIEIANPYEKVESAAVFGQATYTPEGLKSLHLTVGGRLNMDHKIVKGIFTRFGLTPFPYNAYLPRNSHTWRSATYKGEISYDITDTSLVYGSVSTGFKAGGYGYGPGIDPAQGPIYAPERITAYEIGSKNRFFNQKLQLNLEAWYYKYRDYQTNLALFGCTPNCGGLPVLTVASAGDATYKGATLDLSYVATENDLFKLSYSVIDAKYGTFVRTAPAGYSLAPTGSPFRIVSNSISNTNITDVPKWSGVASYSHIWDNVWNGSLDGEVDAQFRGPVLLNLSDDPVYGRVYTRDHAWVTWDLSLRYTPDSANWSATLYAHNIGDALHPISGTYSTSTHAWSEAFNDPRIIGAIFTAKVQ